MANPTNALDSACACGRELVRFVELLRSETRETTTDDVHAAGGTLYMSKDRKGAGGFAHYVPA